MYTLIYFRVSSLLYFWTHYMENISVYSHQYSVLYIVNIYTCIKSLFSLSSLTQEQVTQMQAFAILRLKVSSHFGVFTYCLSSMLFQPHSRRSAHTVRSNKLSHLRSLSLYYSSHSLLTIPISPLLSALGCVCISVFVKFGEDWHISFAGCEHLTHIIICSSWMISHAVLHLRIMCDACVLPQRISNLSFLYRYARMLYRASFWVLVCVIMYYLLNQQFRTS